MKVHGISVGTSRFPCLVFSGGTGILAASLLFWLDTVSRVSSIGGLGEKIVVLQVDENQLGHGTE